MPDNSSDRCDPASSSPDADELHLSAERNKFFTTLPAPPPSFSSFDFHNLNRRFGTHSMNVTPHVGVHHDVPNHAHAW